MYYGIIFLISLLFIGNGAAAMEKLSSMSATQVRKNMALLVAIKNKQYSKVESLVRSGTDLKAKLVNSLPPLVIAIAGDDEKMVSLLIKLGADIEQRCDDETEMTPLIAAIAMNKPNVLSLLVKEGADVHARNKSDHNALLAAAQAGNANAIPTLVAGGAHVNEKNKYGWTALCIAALRGSLPCCTELLKNGADVNIPDNRSITPLMFGAMNGYEEIVVLMLKNGAHVNVQELSGRTAMMLAAKNGHAKIIQMLIAAGGEVDMQAKLAFSPTTDLVEKIAKDMTIETFPQALETMVNIFVKAGLDDKPQIASHTALSLAAKEDQKRVIKTLLKAGADESACNDNATVKATIEKIACAHCGERKGTQLCGGCKKVSYCGKECQRAQWSSHKLECKKS